VSRARRAAVNRRGPFALSGRAVARQRKPLKGAVECRPCRFRGVCKKGFTASGHTVKLTLMNCAAVYAAPSSNDGDAMNDFPDPKAPQFVKNALTDADLLADMQEAALWFGRAMMEIADGNIPPKDVRKFAGEVCREVGAFIILHPVRGSGPQP
jgi:hypothetical protein